MHINKKFLVITLLCMGMFFLQSFIQKEHDEKPTNLKILPKNISEDDLHKIMRNFSKSLGVRCNYCHVSQEVPGQEHPKFDFASDDKIEKKIAREMMKMTEAINSNYIDKISHRVHELEQISCVTCHNGRTTPFVSVDSLAKK